MTAGRPPFPRDLAPVIAELRRLGVRWKRITALLAWRVSDRTLKTMMAEVEGRRPLPVLAGGGQKAAAPPAFSATSTQVASDRPRVRPRPDDVP